MQPILGFVLFGSALLITGPSARGEPSAVVTGHQLVEVNCSRCHATGAAGNSPFAAAPPFRDVAANYTQEELVDGFMEGLAVRHEAMPEWEMTLDQADAIASYIRSLK